ncbi:UNVERIFIED_CONTAM: hypothetical protein HHA_453770 [Hammondia hammondi]|eukprot:XP_008887098.1 hypothetical protein HHA_453770 [Hammondia hammondi]
MVLINGSTVPWYPIQCSALGIETKPQFNAIPTGTKAFNLLGGTTGVVMRRTVLLMLEHDVVYKQDTNTVQDP